MHGLWDMNSVPRHMHSKKRVNCKFFIIFLLFLIFSKISYIQMDLKFVKREFPTRAQEQKFHKKSNTSHDHHSRFVHKGVKSLSIPNIQTRTCDIPGLSESVG